MAEKSMEEGEAEKKKLGELHLAIGEFVFEFSQLEFIIRHMLGEALGLTEIGPKAQFDIVTSSYDFAALCNVTKAIFVRTMQCDEVDQKEIELAMNACLDLNFNARVPIAHGTWFIDESGLGARHVARSKLEMTVKFSKIDDLAVATKTAKELKSRLIRFLIGPIPKRK